MRKYLLIVLILLISSLSITLGHTYHGVAMAPNTLKGWVVRSDTGCIYYTPDCGITWINQSFLAPLSYFDIFSLNEQKCWIIGVQGFVHYTPNGGQRWYRQAMGLSKWTSRIFFINDTCGWAACASAIVGRTIRGNDTIFNMDNWQQIPLYCPPYSPDSCDLHGINFVDQNRGWFCAGRLPYYDPWTNETCFTHGQGYIAKTTDGGGNALTWQLLLRDTINDFFDIKFLDTLNGFVVGGNDRTMSATIMKTQNGGLTWQPINIPSQAKYLRSLEFVGNKAWSVGHYGTILHSDNGGISWTMQTSPIDTTLYDVDFSDSIHGLIAGEGGVLYTHNGGNTWNLANVGVEEEIAMLPLTMTLGVKVYPNPAKSYLTIRFPQTLRFAQGDNCVLKIYDVSGKLVKEIKELVVGDWKISLDRITPGVYFIQLNNQTKPEKLVITK